MALTGYFYTFTRPRMARPMSMLKYDPIGTRFQIAPGSIIRRIPLQLMKAECQGGRGTSIVRANTSYLSSSSEGSLP
jgi:hypothetical protein